MTASNFAASLALVWRPGFDNPRDGYHTTPGDPGGGTLGGVTEATWAAAAKAGIVHGQLAHASDEQLSDVLHALFWMPACDGIPQGLDLLLFNGRMMTGHFPNLMQSCLGYYGDDIDGWIGPVCVAQTLTRDPTTFIDAMTGVHLAYLAGLPTWKRFGAGWSTRLKDVQTVARAMAQPRLIA